MFLLCSLPQIEILLIKLGTLPYRASGVPKMSAKSEKEMPVEIKDKIVEVKEEISDFIKANPLASVALAAGLGFLLAKLLSGRKD